MERLKQKSTWVGFISLISTLVAYFTGAITIDVAAPVLANGVGLIAVNA